MITLILYFLLMISFDFSSQKNFFWDIFQHLWDFNFDYPQTRQYIAYWSFYFWSIHLLNPLESSLCMLSLLHTQAVHNWFFDSNVLQSKSGHYYNIIKRYYLWRTLFLIMVFMFFFSSLIRYSKLNPDYKVIKPNISLF